jgi:hypothetical protein
MRHLCSTLINTSIIYHIGIFDNHRYGEPLKFGLGSAADERSAQTWAEAHGLELRECLKGGKKGARWGGVLSADVQ